VVLHFRFGDGPRLVPDGEYVVFAHRLDAFGRYQFNLPVDPVGSEDALGANLLHDRPSTTSDMSCAGVLPVNSGTARRLAEAHVGQAPN
jgi:hypothetical protein